MVQGLLYAWYGPKESVESVEAYHRGLQADSCDGAGWAVQGVGHCQCLRAQGDAGKAFKVSCKPLAFINLL